MRKQRMTLLGFMLFGACLVLPQTGDRRQPVFVFGGKQLYVGMSKQEAAASLSACCKLSPSAESEVEKKQPAPEGVMVGHFILPKEGSPPLVFGAVYFSGGKVVRLTRPLAEEVDTSNDDVVGFARTIKRSLSTGANDSEASVCVSVRHERMSNAESDVVSLSFPDGRGIELHIGTLDKPDAQTGKRDFASLDETLEPARAK